MNENSTGANGRSQQPIIVLDRDGVINHDSTSFIKAPDEWIAIPGSPEAIAKFSNAGFTVVVASNQSGIGRRLFSLDILDDIHDKMTSTIAAAGGHLDGIYFCPHAPDAGCECRKPKPGLLQGIAKQYACTTDDLVVIGDSLRDLEAAWACDAQAILVRTGNGQKTEQNLPADRQVDIFDDLAAVANMLADH